MPRFSSTPVVASAELSGARYRCDGCDPARPCEEHAGVASLWVVTHGAFELRDRDGRHALDPSRAIVMPAGHAFTIRHPAGPDTCVAFHGPLVERLAAHGPRRLAITPAHAARLALALAARPRDPLAIAEWLAELDVAAEPACPRRDLAAAIVHELRLGYAGDVTLAALAERTGYSPFHACRVFRATTGQTIHGALRELRLRHALAAILDGTESLSGIALETGFASQSHLTNRFRARFGLTPAKARTAAGMRQLARSPVSA